MEPKTPLSLAGALDLIEPAAAALAHTAHVLDGQPDLKPSDPAVLAGFARAVRRLSAVIRAIDLSDEYVYEPDLREAWGSFPHAAMHSIVLLEMSMDLMLTDQLADAIPDGWDNRSGASRRVAEDIAGAVIEWCAAVSIEVPAHA